MAVKYIKNPSEAVQLAVIKEYIWAFLRINNPTPLVIKTALTNPILIGDERAFKQAVTAVFSNNALLMKKWLRYGETMREVGTHK